MRVHFIRDSGGWNDFYLDAARVSFCWQFELPRVEWGFACQERWTGGIVFGEAPEVPHELVPVPDQDAPQPPTTPGFYVAGRAVIGGKLQWILRATTRTVESFAKREDDTAVVAAAEPAARNPGPSRTALASTFTQMSKNGSSVVSYVRNHWRSINRPAIPPNPGCVQNESQYVMQSTELDAPAYEYRLVSLKDPGVYDLEGELCGMMYTPESGTDLAPQTAYLLTRMRVGEPKPGKPGGGLGPGGKASSGGGGAGGALVGGAALVGGVWLLRRIFG